MLKKYHLYGSIVLLLAFVVYLSFPPALDPLTYRVGLDRDTPDPKLYGKEVTLFALTEEILEKLDYSFVLVDLQNELLLKALKGGEVDVIITRQPIDFLNQDSDLVSSKTYFPLGPILVVKKTSPVESSVDMRGKTLGVQKSAHLWNSLEPFSPFVLFTASTIWDLFDLILLNRVDGIVLDTLGAYLYTKKLYKGELKLIFPPLTDSGFKMVGKKGTKGEKAVSLFDQGLLSLQESGFLQRLVSKWGFPGYPIALSISPGEPR